MLRAVGYWRQNEDGPGLPHPKFLVQEGWYGSVLERIVGYLKGGHNHISFAGYSFCRFECGAPPQEMGSCDLWDGEWVWPGGLAHYVACHSIRLPDEFIGTMRSRSWQVPPEAEMPEGHIFDRGDFSFWTTWARRFALRFAPDCDWPSLARRWKGGEDPPSLAKEVNMTWGDLYAELVERGLLPPPR